MKLFGIKTVRPELSMLLDNGLSKIQKAANGYIIERKGKLWVVEGDEAEVEKQLTAINAIEVIKTSMVQNHNSGSWEVWWNKKTIATFVSPVKRVEHINVNLVDADTHHTHQTQLYIPFYT